jgi:hypothetical protein
VFYAMKISRDLTCACILTFVAVNVLILIVDYTTNSDRISSALLYWYQERQRNYY